MLRFSLLHSVSTGKSAIFFNFTTVTHSTNCFTVSLLRVTSKCSPSARVNSICFNLPCTVCAIYSRFLEIVEHFIAFESRAFSKCVTISLLFAAHMCQFVEICQGHCPITWRVNHLRFDLNCIFQLLMVVHFKHHCNTYGSLSAYIVAFFLRLSGGESIIGLQPLIHYPGWDEENQRQLFPFRTMAMLMSLITLVGVSAYTKWVFESGRLAPQYDYFRCVVNIPDDAIRVGDPSEVGEQVNTILLFYSFSN